MPPNLALADRAGPVDEPQLGEETEVHDVAHRGHVLEAQVHVAQHLEQRRLVRRVAVRVRHDGAVRIE